MLSETGSPPSLKFKLTSYYITMDLQNPFVVKAYISREGKHISVLKENHVLSIYRYQPLAESELIKPIWEVENVRRLVDDYFIAFVS